MRAGSPRFFSGLRLGLLTGLFVAAAAASLVTGCRSELSSSPPPFPSQPVPTPNLDHEIAAASLQALPLLVLVTDSDAGANDERARAALRFVCSGYYGEKARCVLLDISASRNRAEAGRFHVEATPALFTLSPMGLILSRDSAPITRAVCLHRLLMAHSNSLAEDGRFAALQQAISRNADDIAARLELADFLLAHQNIREAIPHFELVARSATAETALRVRAWVELARGRLWIAEPEKARHEAEALRAALGPASDLARSGADLVMGLLDVRNRQLTSARRNFEASIAEAPGSRYAKDAASYLENLLRQ
jgi:hypothetical protein